MKRSLVGLGSVTLLSIAPQTMAQPRSSGPLPQLPGGDEASSSQAPESLTPQQLYARLRRGVVAIERNGIPTAIGTVLAGDGRVLTAMSGLGGADGADVRYADGTAVHAKVGHSDKDLDLALLVPQTLKWTDGLSASDVDPLGADLRAMIPGRGAHVGPAGAGVKGHADAHGHGGEPLLQMLDVDVKGPPVAGAPLLDLTGRVVAVLVRACRGPSPQSEPAPSVGSWPEGEAAPVSRPPVCTPMVVGAPVSAIREFLSHSPATNAPSAAWLGIRGETEASGNVRGVRVVAVAPSSPAERAGLKSNGDIIVAVDGQAVDTSEKLADAIAKRSAGDSVKLLVFGTGKFREVAVALRAAP